MPPVILRGMQSYDAIILGLGAMGSSAAYHLARRGARVLGLEQFTPAHDRGSSHGVTRIIRKAYFEHPDYIPLLHRAYALWDALGAETGQKLFHRTGLLLIGRPDGPVIPGVRRAAALHNLDIRDVPIGEVAARFPGIRPHDETQALYEPDAGYLLVEECVRAHLDLAARKHGAALRYGEPVREWKSENDGGVRVITSAGEYAGRTLVLCAGPWSARFLGALGAKLEVRRKVQLWFACRTRDYELGAGFPVFCVDSADGFFYGFPAADPGCVKVAEHTGREVVNDADALERALHAADSDRVTAFVRRSLPGIRSDRIVRHSVCMYTMTPDEHFILDRSPEFPNVFIAAGFSGHGFKFSSVVGSVLADLVTRGSTVEPVGFLSAGRLLARNS